MFSKSLGSTGFSTVVEMEGSNADVSQENCFDKAMNAYDLAERVYPDQDPSGYADLIYVDCLLGGGSPGSQEPVVIEG